MNEIEIENANDKIYNKNYYTTNKQKILDHMKQKIICDCCDKSVNKSHLNRHKATKFCQMVKNVKTYMNDNPIVNNKDDIDVKELKSQLDEIKTKLEQLKL